MIISLPSRTLASSLLLASARVAATSACSRAISVAYFCRVSLEASHDVIGVEAIPIRANNISVLIVV